MRKEDEIALQIHRFKKRHKLTQKETEYILESYRRIMKFNKGYVTNTFAMLSAPSYLKGVRHFYTPYNKETKGIKNWYVLSKKGKELVKDLKETFYWDLELDNYIWNL